MMRQEPPGVVIPAERCGRLSRQLAYLVRLVQQQNGGLPVGEDFGWLLNQVEDAAAIAARGRAPAKLSAEPRQLTVIEAAPVMGVSPRRVRQLAEGKSIIARKIGRDWAIDERSAQEWRSRLHGTPDDDP